MQNRKVYEMEAIEIVKNIGEGKTPYERAVYLMNAYKDLKNGKEIMQESREVIELMDKVFSLIDDDPYIDIVEYHYKKGYGAKKTAYKMGIDVTTLYRQRRRIAKRVAIILYGDKALI